MAQRESVTSPFDYNNKWNIRRTSLMHAKALWAMSKRGHRNMTDYFMHLINQDVEKLRLEFKITPEDDGVYEMFKEAAQDEYVQLMIKGVIEEVVEGKVAKQPDKEKRKALREKLRKELQDLLIVKDEVNVEAELE